jgi:hypothetical protein
MLSRSVFLTLSGAAAVAQAAPAVPSGDAEADRIFRRAKEVWLLRREAPFLTYGMRESYVWRDRPHENWWRASFRSSDRQLALERVIVPEQEQARLRGIAIGLHIHFHSHKAAVESLDTNPDSDAFPILDPMIEPSSGFGMVRQATPAKLVDTQTASPSAGATATPLPTPVPTLSPEGEATPLHELARVEVFGRDYQIALVGIEHLAGGDAYHLSLTPLRNPQVYRLRDLWVATDSYATLQLAVDGLFEGKPYEDARWTVSYVPIGGQYYIQQIRTDEVLRFGLDRKVSGFTFDFVDYALPPTLPGYLFEKLL